MAFITTVPIESGIHEADVQALRDHGFTDPEVFDIAATAAARCFFSKRSTRWERSRMPPMECWKMICAGSLSSEDQSAR